MNGKVGLEGPVKGRRGMNSPEDLLEGVAEALGELLDRRVGSRSGRGLQILGHVLALREKGERGKEVRGCVAGPKRLQFG